MEFFAGAQEHRGFLRCWIVHRQWDQPQLSSALMTMPNEQLCQYHRATAGFLEVFRSHPVKVYNFACVETRGGAFVTRRSLHVLMPQHDLRNESRQSRYRRVQECAFCALWYASLSSLLNLISVNTLSDQSLAASPIALASFWSFARRLIAVERALISSAS